MTLALPAWQKQLELEATPPSLRRLVIAGTATIVLGFGSFFAWSALASLDSATPALGSVVVESKRKTVSVLDGGILKELLVKEGDRVAAGQILLRLDEVQAQAQLGQAKAQYWGMLARQARLRAEHADEHAMTISALLAASADDPFIAGFIETERRLFHARWKNYEGTLAVQAQKIKQLGEQIVALQSQHKAVAARLRYTEEELVGANELYSKGYERKTRILDLQRSIADLRGSFGELTAREAEARHSIAGTELEMMSTRNQRHSDVVKELEDTEAQLADATEKQRALLDTLQRKVVTAPEAGTVTDIKFFTPGSSVAPGQPILDLVPGSGKLLIEVNVNPNDVEHVHPGQRVSVRLLSYKAHKVPVLCGRLTYVSADRQLDPQGQPFFLARAELDPDALDRFKAVRLYPGLPAEVLIIGGERRALDYFLTPVTGSLWRAFRED